MTKEEIIRQVYTLLESNNDTKKYIIVDPTQVSQEVIGAPVPKPH